MPFVLEGPQPAEHNGEAEVDVGRRRIDPELHAKRPPELQLLLEPALGLDVDRVTSELGAAHCAATLPLQSSASRAALRPQTGARKTAAQNPQAAPARAPLDPPRPRHRLVHVRARDRDRERDPIPRSGPPPEAGG